MQWLIIIIHYVWCIIIIRMYTIDFSVNCLAENIWWTRRFITEIHLPMLPKWPSRFTSISLAREVTTACLPRCSSRDDEPYPAKKGTLQDRSHMFFSFRRKAEKTTLSRFNDFYGLVQAIWVCLKIGYIPNYSHLIGIMIINHWV